MNNGWRRYAVLLGAMILCLLVGACGDSSPWHYNPGIPAKPVALAASTGDGQVSLNWTPAANAAGYYIYYATSPGAAVGAGTKILTTAASSTIVTGLTNDVTYYFAITAVNASGESAPSDQVNIAPTPSGPFQQGNLQGTWRFNALVSGAGAGWMRGTADIDNSGNVAVTSFLDSSGNVTAPIDLFTTMTILPDGTVLQSGAAAGFQGSLASNLNKDTLVGVAGTAAGSSRLMVLQKQVAGTLYSSSDIKGTGKAVAGPLSFVYHQLSSGANQEWEYASGQIGQDQSATYLSINAPTPRQLPGAGSKSTSFAITADGTVTETATPGVLPQPAAVIGHGFMSADKMTIVGTMTDVNGAFLLRIIQLIHPPSTALTSSSYPLASLKGSYSLHTLTGGANPFWAYGGLVVDPVGNVTFSSYLNSFAGSTAPAPFTLAMDQQGSLTNVADPTYNGKLSYLADMMVSTRTDATGGSTLDIALKK